MKNLINKVLDIYRMETGFDIQIMSIIILMSISIIAMKLTMYCALASEQSTEVKRSIIGEMESC